MASLQAAVNEYQQQLKKGSIQIAYKGILEYLSTLRTTIEKQHPEWLVPGGLYSGYMDMSYFSMVPAALKEKKLKIAVVFIHEGCRFEVWLSAVNKNVQAEYWNLIRSSGWDLYKLVGSLQGADAIIEHGLIESPDFDDQKALTRDIESGVVKFIDDIEALLSKCCKD